MIVKYVGSGHPALTTGRTYEVLTPLYDFPSDRLCLITTDLNGTTCVPKEDVVAVVEDGEEVK